MAASGENKRAYCEHKPRQSGFDVRGNPGPEQEFAYGVRMVLTLAAQAASRNAGALGHRSFIKKMPDS